MTAGLCAFLAILVSVRAASNPAVHHLPDYSPSPSEFVTFRQADPTSPGSLLSPLPSATPVPSFSSYPSYSASYSPFPTLSAFASFSPIRSSYPSLSAFPSPRTCSVVLQHDVPQTRILGGIEASNGTASYMAALLAPYYREQDPSPSDAPPADFVCSAVVIAPRWLLTAAHCRVQTNWTVKFGGPDAYTGRSVRVAEAFAPGQNGGDDFSYDRDVSVVRLQSDAPPRVTFALVNSDPEKPYAEAYARGVGYGLTRDPRSGEFLLSDEVLRQVDVPTAHQEFCQNAYNIGDLHVEITQNMVCVGSNGCGPCFGDSGGPLIQFDSNGRPVVMGIVSGGIRCGDGERPAIFARTNPFNDWMRGNGAEFNSTDDAQQVNADGTALAPTPTPQVAGVNSRPVTVYVLIAVAAVVAAVGLMAVLLRFRYTRAQNDDEVAVEISPA